MTSIPDTISRHIESGAEADARFQPFALQVLSLLLYGGFAIVATILAFVHFWPAGVVLAMYLAWRGFGPDHPRPEQAIAAAVGTVIPGAAPTRSSGNASFDAYRADMLARLEDEQKKFEDFLGRLRAARDSQEFDSFMDARARRMAPSDET